MHYHPTSSLAYSSVKTATTILLVLSLNPAQGLPETSTTAAMQDWIPKGSTSDTIPWYCDGHYKQPASINANQGKVIIGTADDALHVEDHSTSFDGNVVIDGQGRQIRASHLTLDSATDIVTADGPVTLREDGLLLKGDHASGNLFAGTGVMDNATFLLHQSRMRGTARTIIKRDDDTLVIKDGTFTRCDPDSNQWQFKSADIKLNQAEGYGVARNATVRIKGVPIAYFPYIRFPLDDQRYSGFLMPSAGHDGDGGTDIAIPYYFNLSPNHDATYTFRSLWKRGLIHDAEYRYLNNFSSNFINLAYLHEDDKFAEPSSGAFDKQDRWLLYFNHVGTWSRRWRSLVNYGALSDVDYLQDIGGDIDASTQETNKSFQSLGTNIPALRRYARLTYRRANWYAELNARSYQSLSNNAAKQYSRLPQLVVNVKENLSIFDVAVRSQFSQFDKDNENVRGILATVGNRFVTEASIKTDFRMPWGFIKPELGAIHRSYDLTDAPATTRTTPDITIPFVALDSGLIFDRFFSWRNRDLLQTLEPRLYLLYVAEEYQDDLPRFDAAATTPGFSTMFRRNRYSGYDRVGDARQASIGITSSLFDARTGAEFLKASVGQIIYFEDRHVIFNPDRAYDPTAGSSALFTQARLRLNRRLSITGAYEFESRASRSNRGKLSLKYRGPNNRRIVNLNYTYTNPEVQNPARFQNAEETDLSFIWPLKGKWSLLGRWNFGWDKNQTLESLVGVEYNDCCWKTRLAYRRYQEEPRTISVAVRDPVTGTTSVESALQYRSDSGFFFEFQLKGLSTLGKRLDTLLEDSIPGYRRREDTIE